MEHSIIKCSSPVKIAQAILEGRCSSCYWASFTIKNDRKIPSNFCGAASNLLKKLEEWFEICQKPFPCQLSEKERSCYLCLKLIALRQCSRKNVCQPVFMDALREVVEGGKSIFKPKVKCAELTIIDESGKSSIISEIEEPKVNPETPKQTQRRTQASGIIRNNPIVTSLMVKKNGINVSRMTYLSSGNKDLVCKGCHSKASSLYTKKQLCFGCLKLKKQKKIIATAPPSIQKDHLCKIFGSTTVNNLKKIGIFTISGLIKAIKSDEDFLITKFGARSMTQTISTLKKAGIDI